MVRLALLLGLLTPAQQTYYQPHRQYLAAIADESTNLFVVFVTIEDANNGIVRSGCVPASFLLGAIHRERELGYDAASVATARRLASDPSHRFIFKSAEALANLPMDEAKWAKQACAIVRKGHAAYIADISGQVVDAGAD